MLSPSQLKARAGKLTGSRIAALMTGNVEAIDRLYREMLGEAIPEDLSHIWAVRLGEATEQLNLDWYERKNGVTLARRGEVVVHPTLPWAAATLDAWDEVLSCPIEVKHTGGREPLEVIIERYWPQMGWQMEVTGAVQCGLSVIMGASEPIVEYIPRDADYAAEMVRRGEQFMEHVWNRTPPVVLPAVPAPVDASRVYDMTGSNVWAGSAADWLENKDAAEVCKNAERILKNLVPEDAVKASGHGVRITRDRAKRLSLREAQ